MDQQNRIDELNTAWRALIDDIPEQIGWKTIPITHNAKETIYAGRKYPEGNESLIIVFQNYKIEKESKLPQSYGFAVKLIDDMNGLKECTCVALCRNPQGRTDIFTTMACDIILFLENNVGKNSEYVFSFFISRIETWQEFMKYDRNNRLSKEEEIGLFGELVFLNELLETDMSQDLIIKTWKGPLGGLHDFVIGNGAIEIKTSTTHGKFIAKISTLDQLDNTKVATLFLSTLLLSEEDDGLSLSGIIEKIRVKILGSNILSGFNDLLLRTKYSDMQANIYTCKYKCIEKRILQIDDNFPKLTHSNVPFEVKNAQYDLIIDVDVDRNLQLSTVLRILGGVKK